MTPVEHTSSYYAASANPSPRREALQESVRADVAIIGAGFSGISSALHLAEKGFKVVVLESARVGWGASGRNGGQIVNSYSRDMDVIEKAYGVDTARALGAMAFEGGDIIRQRIEQYDIDCDLKHGGIFAAITTKQLKGLEEHKALWERYGHTELTMLDKRAIADEIQTDRYEGGLLDMRSGHIHPLNLVLGQAAAVESLGGKIYEQSKVERVEEGEQVKLYTASGDVTADYVVVTGNAYLGNLIPKLSARSMPCGTQMIATAPLSDEQAKSLIPANYCVEDCNYLLDYFRLTGDNRLIYGGGVNYGGGDPADIKQFIRKKMLATFPQLKDVDIEFGWGGDFLLTMSRLPQFGRIGSNIYYMQGYSGHGVCSTHLAGRLLSEALTQQAERFDAFANLPHLPFPGGHTFRVPFTAMGAWFYALRDKLGI